MKKIITLLILSLPLLVLQSQDFEVQTVQNDLDYLLVQIRETSGTGMPTTTNDITDLQFEIRWPQSYGSDLDVDLICDTWSLVEGLGARQSEGTYYWRVFAAMDVPFSPSSDWVEDQWETVGIFRIVTTSTSGTGDFDIPADAWVVQGLNFGIDGHDFTPVPYDLVTGLPFPTLVYDYVWKGGTTLPPDYDEHSWTLGSNWENPCGTHYSPTEPPSAGFNCIIPGGLTYYPSNFYVTGDGFCDFLRIRNGASVSVPGGATLNTVRILCETGSDLTIEPGGAVDVEE